ERPIARHPGRLPNVAGPRRFNSGLPSCQGHGTDRRMSDSTATIGQPFFWQRKSLAEMTPDEWESLCDGCGRCCLVKLEDEDTGTIHFTDIGCRLLDGATCRCRDYQNRTARVDDCVRLTARNLSELNWLPPTCAYRLIAAGHDLYW